MRKSAELIHKTPATVSAAISRLEGQLNQRLFERNTRKLRLTNSGRLLKEHAQRIADINEQIAEDFSVESEQMEGLLRITAPLDLSGGVLSDTIDALQKDYPELVVQLYTSDKLENLISEPIDVAIRYGVPKDSELIARTVVDNERIAVCSPMLLSRFGGISSPCDLDQLPCLGLSSDFSPPATWKFFDSNENLENVSPRFRRVTNNGQLLKKWAMQGIGVAYKSELDVREEIRSGELVNIFPHYRGEKAPLQVVTASKSGRTRRVDCFVNYFLSTLKKT